MKKSLDPPPTFLHLFEKSNISNFRTSSLFGDLGARDYFIRVRRVIKHTKTLVKIDFRFFVKNNTDFSLFRKSRKGEHKWYKV